MVRCGKCQVEVPGCHLDEITRFCAEPRCPLAVSAVRETHARWLGNIADGLAARDEKQTELLARRQRKETDMYGTTELRCSRDLALRLGAITPATMREYRSMQEAGWLLVRDPQSGWPAFWEWQPMIADGTEGSSR